MIRLVYLNHFQNGDFVVTQREFEALMLERGITSGDPIEEYFPMIDSLADLRKYILPLLISHRRWYFLPLTQGCHVGD